MKDLRCTSWTCCLPLLAWLGAGGCAPDLGVPEAAQISCENGICPEGWRCSGGMCVPELVNLPPNAIISTPQREGRWLDEVRIPISISDPNGDIDGLRYRVEFRLTQDDAWSVAAGTTGTVAQASALPQSLGVVWDLLTDADNQVGGLSAVSLQREGAATPEDVVTYQAEVFLRVVVTDGDGLSATSPLNVPISLGNDTPVLTLTDAVGAAWPTNGVAALLSGTEQLNVDVADAADAADLEAELSLDGANWVALTPSFGATTDLAPGATHSFLWDTTQPPGAGGVGLVDATQVLLHVRGVDEPQPGVRHVGEWSDSVTVAVHNQSRPRVASLVALNASRQELSHALTIRYGLVDEEGDPVDVRIDFSVDAASTWAPCREFPTPKSEGFYDLATRPTSEAEGKGVEHLFVWDAAANIGARNGAVLVRIIAADDDGPGGATVGSLANMGVQGTWASSEWTTLYSYIGFGVVQGLGDPGVDSRRDMVSRRDTELLVWEWDGTALQPTTLASDVTAACVATLNSDRYADLLFVESGQVRAQLGSAAGFSPSGSYSPATTAVALSCGDLNGDGYTEALILDDAHLATVVGSPGDGSLSAFGSSLNVGAPVALVTDLDGDGAADAVVNNVNLVVYRGSLVSTGVFPLVTPAVVLGVAGSPQVLGGDLDLDGATDLVVLHGDKIRLGLGDSAGGFSFLAPQDLPTRFDSDSTFLGDLDGDGALELIGKRNPGVWVLRVGAEGVSVLYERLSQAFVSIRDFFVGDWDGDGQVELFSDGTMSSFAATLYSDIRSFDPIPQAVDPAFAPTFSTYGTVSSSHAIARDVDFDGVQDVLLVGDQVGVYLGRADNGHTQAAFAADEAYGLSGSGAVTNAALADFDGDGADDVLGFAKWVSSPFRVALGVVADGVPTGAFVAAAAVSTFTPEAYVFFGTDDYDDDGRAEVLLYEAASSDVVLAEADLSSGSWDGTFVLRSLATVANVERAALVDVDQDGDRDLLYVADQASKSMGYLVNDGTSFTCPSRCANCEISLNNLTAGQSEYVRSINTTDLNRDGLPDFLLAGGTYCGLCPEVPRIWNYRNDIVNDQCTPFAFVEDLARTVDRQLERLQLADIDGDGALDLLSSAGPQVPIRGVGQTFLGWPTGAFGSLDWHPEDGQETRMAIYLDANEDGYLDLVTMDMVSTRLRTAVGGRLVPLEYWSSATLDPATDRFGRQVRSTVGRRRVSFDLRDLLPRASYPGRLIHISRPYELTGDIRLRHVLVDDEVRVQVSSVAELGAGLLVKIPIEHPFAGLLGPNPLVVRATRDWQRANEVSADPLSADPRAASLLPRVTKGGATAARDIYRESYTARVIRQDPDDDLTTGSGSRWVRRGWEIHVFTDELGVFQIFHLE